MSIVTINYNKKSDPEILSIDEIMNRDFSECVYKSGEDLFLIVNDVYIIQIRSDQFVITWDTENHDDYENLQGMGKVFQYVEDATFNIVVNMP